MLKRIIGQAMLSKARKRLSGGPQALKPLRPMKGSGVKNATGRAAKRPRSYVVPKQNPLLSPKGGLFSRKKR